MGFSPRMFRALGWCWLVIGLAAVPFILIAAAEGADSAVRGFAVSAGLGIFAGGLSLASTRGIGGPARAVTGLRFLFYGWLSSPLIAAPPLIAAAGAGIPGLFEAYSALTTTGASVLVPDEQARSIVLWRAVLQWIGGFATLVVAATVFAALEPPGTNLRRSTLLTAGEEDLFLNFSKAVRRLGLVYGIITVAATLLLSMTALNAFDALCLALSAISTGGMTPQAAPLDQWLPVSAQAILAITCLLGGWNLALQYELLSRGRAVRLSGDLYAIVATCLALALLAGLVFGPQAAGPALLESIFALTTAGFQAGAETVFPVVLLLSLAVIGGSALSTSGGVKITRIILLLRRAGGELSLLAHPSAAVYTRFAGRHVSDTALLNVWVFALSFPFAIGVTGVALGLSGLDFSAAWQVAAATIANAGPIAQIDYAGLSGPAQLIAILAMVAGRLEILLAAAAVFVIVVGE